MPSETFHATHQGSKPGEQVTESGLVLPAGVGRERNLRGEPVSFDNLGTRSTKYNSPGVDFDNPYNAFAPEAVQEEVASKELADDQPRRVRNELNGNGEERLVKYVDGTFDWVPVDPSEREFKGGVTQEVLEQVAGGIDSLEVSKERHDEELSNLRDEVTELKRQIAELSGNSDVNTASETEVAAESTTAESAVAEQEEAAEVEQTPDEGSPKYPGQELELYNQAGKEIELLEEPGSETIGKELDLIAPPDTKEIEAPKAEASSFEIEIDTEAFEASISEARDKYAELTAKHRAGYWGHFLQDSKHLIKIPGVARLRDWAKEKTDTELTEARDEYKKAVFALQTEILDKTMEKYGDGETEQRIAKRAAGEVAMESEAQLELKIAAERMQKSGDTNAFINWWVRQEGLGGKFKKAGLIAAGGLTIGIVAGLGGAPLIGIAAGGLAGGGVGAWVTKKRASGITERGGTTTLAENQGQEDIIAKSNYAQEQLEGGDGFVSIDQLTALTEERTAKEKAGNRARVKGAAGAGAAGASAGAAIGGAIREGIINAAASEPQATARAAGEVIPKAPAAPEMVGTNFDIQSGSSFTQELMEFAGANGHALTPDQSYSLHNELLQNFGNYIQDGAGNPINTYTEANEIRIGAPGGGQWAPGVSEYIQNWMTTRGL